MTLALRQLNSIHKKRSHNFFFKKVKVHPSLHPNWHHQIVYAKFDLLIHFPPIYSREVWHYKDANTELTKKAIEKFLWQRAFSNSSVNEKVVIFNNTVVNILSNFIPHETIVCDAKDPP